MGHTLGCTLDTGTGAWGPYGSVQRCMKVRANTQMYVRHGGLRWGCGKGMKTTVGYNGVACRMIQNVQTNNVKRGGDSHKTSVVADDTLRVGGGHRW